MAFLTFPHLQCSTYGRLDVVRVANSLFDSMTIVSPSMCASLQCSGSVQMMTIGDRVTLTPGNVTISNSDISGAYISSVFLIGKPNPFLM